MHHQEIIEKYYTSGSELHSLLMLHGQQVADKAIAIARRHPELGLDEDFLLQAGMLHDIGIFLTDAPGIHCHGAMPYLCHGLLGGILLRREGWPEMARICERHTGTGLTAKQITLQGLPLIPADYRPESLAEEVICYADKFFSKSHPERIRSVEDTARSLAKFGEESVEIFLKWAERFE